jgi:hypothetical protein
MVTGRPHDLPPTTTRWLGRGLVMGLGLLLGCQAVIDGELGTVNCKVEGAFGPPACPEGESCVAGVCTAVGVPSGGACEQDSECAAPGFCLDPSTVGEGGAKRCTRTCCASNECGPPGAGQVCHAPQAGDGMLCWPAAELGRGAPGQVAAGEACSANEDCRSGSCDGQRCIDTCCNDAFCGGDAPACRLRLVATAPAESWGCGQPASSADNADCNSNDDCRSGRCLPVDPDLSLCANPCCKSAECGQTLVLGIEKLVACAPLDGGNALACSVLLPLSANGDLGAECSVDEDCRSGICASDSNGNYCSDVCCDDTSCGDATRFSCRPHADGGTWSLRCLRK